MSKNILIIKHGSFGDLVFATGAMKSINKFFLNHKIYLLTSSNYKDFIKNAPFIDKVLEDDRHSFIKLKENVILINKLIKINFDYIFDLQNSTRTSIYNLIFKIYTNSKISSSRQFSHFRYEIPSQGKEHVVTGLNKQLSLVGINSFFPPNVNWLSKNFNNKIRRPFALIIPGTSKNGDYKRWPAKNYAEIASYLEKKRITIVVAGTKQDKNSADPIFEKCNNALNFLDKSPPNILFNLAKKSKFIISNDTGPAILSALSNKPLIWIVNKNIISRSNKPFGRSVIEISNKNILNISTERVKKILIKNHLI